MKNKFRTLTVNFDLTELAQRESKLVEAVIVVGYFMIKTDCLIRIKMINTFFENYFSRPITIYSAQKRSYKWSAV
ncbi:hypothetical protein SDC9_112356 [bioreactor metagenome]|uniref:Uncharacterized protein n=1 Tax=bioreactor metagenome TaxID=1076179 RepID=A0A645BJ16_9ZZZZ